MTTGQLTAWPRAAGLMPAAEWASQEHLTHSPPGGCAAAEGEAGLPGLQKLGDWGGVHPENRPGRLSCGTFPCRMCDSGWDFPVREHLHPHCSRGPMGPFPGGLATQLP